MRKIFIVFMMIVCPAAFADFATERIAIQNAIKEILRKEGDANLLDARKFWSHIPRNQEAEQAARIFANEYTRPINEIQHQMWTCIRQAWIEKRSNRCESAERFLKNMEEKFGKENFDRPKLQGNLIFLIMAASRNDRNAVIGNDEYALSLEIIDQTIGRIDRATKNLIFVISNKPTE
jgi:hypothetical protein